MQEDSKSASLVIVNSTYFLNSMQEQEKLIQRYIMGNVQWYLLYVLKVYVSAN